MSGAGGGGSAGCRGGVEVDFRSPGGLRLAATLAVGATKGNRAPDVPAGVGASDCCAGATSDAAVPTASAFQLPQLSSSSLAAAAAAASSSAAESSAGSAPPTAEAAGASTSAAVTLGAAMPTASAVQLPQLSSSSPAAAAAAAPSSAAVSGAGLSPPAVQQQEHHQAPLGAAQLAADTPVAEALVPPLLLATSPQYYAKHLEFAAFPSKPFTDQCAIRGINKASERATGLSKLERTHPITRNTSRVAKQLHCKLVATTQHETIALVLFENRHQSRTTSSNTPLGI